MRSAKVNSNYFQKKAGSLSLLSLTSIFFMSRGPQKNESNKTNFQLQFVQLPWLALSTPDVATKPSRPYRLGIWQMQSDLATNLSPGWKWPARLVSLNFCWRKHKTAFWDKLRQVFVTHFFLCFSCFIKNTKTQHHPPLCWCRFLCCVEIWKFPTTFCLSSFQNVSLSAVFPAFNTMILSIDLSTRWLTLNSTLGWHEPWNPDEFSFRKPYFRGLWNNPQI